MKESDNVKTTLVVPPILIQYKVFYFILDHRTIHVTIKANVHRFIADIGVVMT